MKQLTTIMLAVTACLVGCTGPQAPRTDTLAQQLKSDVPDRIGSVKTPVAVTHSPLIGLTRAEVIEREGIEKLKPLDGTDTVLSFTGGTRFPGAYGDGYIWSRLHLLTFENGKVIRHEYVDRITGHMTVVPADDLSN